MNHDPVFQRLRELAWRRELTDSEQAELQAWLATHPAARAEAEMESALSEALARLPDAPVPSNFTARVLSELEREVRHPSSGTRDWPWIWRVLCPRAAAAALVLAGGLFAYHRHLEARRFAFGDSIRTVAGVQSLPSPVILEYFDVIQKLDTPPPADKDLVAWLQ